VEKCISPLKKWGNGVALNSPPLHTRGYGKGFTVERCIGHTKQPQILSLQALFLYLCKKFSEQIVPGFWLVL